jgi:hypothetical protein
VSSTEDKVPVHVRWTGGRTFMPGSGNLEPNRIYLTSELRKGAHQHPLMTPATAKQFEAQGKRESKGADES